MSKIKENTDDEVHITTKELMELLWSDEFKDLLGTEYIHIKNHLEKISICDIYGWNDDEDIVKYFDICERGKSK